MTAVARDGVIQAEYKKIIATTMAPIFKKIAWFIQSYFDLPRGREARNNMVPASGAMQR
jgi:hypothetical protein